MHACVYVCDKHTYRPGKQGNYDVGPMGRGGRWGPQGYGAIRANGWASNRLRSVRAGRVGVGARGASGAGQAACAVLLLRSLVVRVPGAQTGAAYVVLMMLVCPGTCESIQKPCHGSLATGATQLSGVCVQGGARNS